MTKTGPHFVSRLPATSALQFRHLTTGPGRRRPAHQWDVSRCSFGHTRAVTFRGTLAQSDFLRFWCLARLPQSLALPWCVWRMGRELYHQEARGSRSLLPADMMPAVTSGHHNDSAEYRFSAVHLGGLDCRCRPPSRSRITALHFQRDMSSLYAAADAMVLPAEHDPFLRPFLKPWPLGYLLWPRDLAAFRK